MNAGSIGLGSLLALLGVVASGAVLPVVPTGAAVSVAAALAERGDPVLVLLVVVFGAAGAYLSDLATYAGLRFAGLEASRGTGRLARWFTGANHGRAVDEVRLQLERHELRTLLLSRLVPGGQLPVLVAAVIGHYSWRRFAAADVAAATLWSTVYAAIGVAGRAVFPRAWEGVAAGVAIVVVVSAVAALWGRHRATAG